MDNYLGISDDFQVYVKPQADVKEYSSDRDNQMAAALLVELQRKMSRSYVSIVDILVQKLSSITQVLFLIVCHLIVNLEVRISTRLLITGLISGVIYLKVAKWSNSKD